MPEYGKRTDVNDECLRLLGQRKGGRVGWMMMWLMRQVAPSSFWRPSISVNSATQLYIPTLSMHPSIHLVSQPNCIANSSKIHEHHLGCHGRAGPLAGKLARAVNTRRVPECLCHISSLAAYFGQCSKHEYARFSMLLIAQCLFKSPLPSKSARSLPSRGVNHPIFKASHTLALLTLSPVCCFSCHAPMQPCPRLHTLGNLKKVACERGSEKTFQFPACLLRLTTSPLKI